MKSLKKRKKKLKEMVIGCWIQKTISRDEWREYWRSTRRNENEWIEIDKLNTLLSEEAFEMMLKKSRDPLEWFVDFSALSWSEVHCSMVRLIDRTIYRVQSVEEDAHRHRVVCGLLERAFQIIENPKQTLIDSSLLYLVKIFQSQHWNTIDWAVRVSWRLHEKNWLGRGQPIHLSELSEKLRYLATLWHDQLKQSIIILHGYVLEKSKEAKLAEVKKMLIGYWIHDTISRDEWEEYERRNDEEWIEKEGLNTLLNEEIFKVLVEEQRDPFGWFVSSLSLSWSEVQRSLVRLVERTTDRMESVEEGAHQHSAVCELLERVFEVIENPSQTLIDSTEHYLVKIFQSQHWLCIEKAKKISSSKWLDRAQVSEGVRVKFDDALVKMSRNEKKTEEKLKELKEMVIGRWIDETVSLCE